MLPKNFREHIRKILVLAWPVCMSNIGHVMVGIVDTAMVGGIDESLTGYNGTTAQAAVSLANSFYFLVLVFGLGVSYGVTPLVAKADSTNNTDENAQLLKHALIVNVVTNAFLFLLLAAISPLLHYIHQPKDVVALAIPFLNVMMLGMLPLAVFAALKQFAEGLSFTRVAMFISVGTNLINILLNWVLIYGKFGFTPMGVMGSCWATFLARVLMAVGMFVYIFYGKAFLKFRAAFTLKKISMQKIKEIFLIGATSGLQWVFEVSAFAFALVMIGWIGKKEQAAHQIALQLAAFTYLIASGLSAAASVRVGNYVGQKNNSMLRDSAFTAFTLVILSQTIFALLFIALRFAIPTLFNNEQEVIQIVSSLLIIAALFQIPDGIQVVGLGVLRGMEDVTIPTWITFLAYWIIGLPASYVFAFQLGLGVNGVWYGLTLGLTVSAILLFRRFHYISRDKGMSAT